MIPCSEPIKIHFHIPDMTTKDVTTGRKNIPLKKVPTFFFWANSITAKNSPNAIVGTI
jgi:hypothetical protein